MHLQSQDGSRKEEENMNRYFEGILMFLGLANGVMVCYIIFGWWTFLINLLFFWGLYHQVRYGGKPIDKKHS